MGLNNEIAELNDEKKTHQATIQKLLRENYDLRGNPQPPLVSFYNPHASKGTSMSSTLSDTAASLPTPDTPNTSPILKDAEKDQTELGSKVMDLTNVVSVIVFFIKFNTLF